MYRADQVTLNVRLLDEAVDVWRPALATPMGDGRFRLAIAQVPEDELWEFAPGTVVTGEPKELSGGIVQVAMAPPSLG